MSQLIEPSGIKARRLVSGGSRYADKTVIYYGDQRFITFPIYVRKPYFVTGQERLIVITPGLQYRPDLMSYDFYGFPDNWWKILEANRMKDIWEFKAGKTILLPEVSA